MRETLNLGREVACLHLKYLSEGVEAGECLLVGTKLSYLQVHQHFGFLVLLP